MIGRITSVNKDVMNSINGNEIQWFLNHINQMKLYEFLINTGGCRQVIESSIQDATSYIAYNDSLLAFIDKTNNPVDLLEEFRTQRVRKVPVRSIDGLNLKKFFKRIEICYKSYVFYNYISECRGDFEDEFDFQVNTNWKLKKELVLGSIASSYLFFLVYSILIKEVVKTFPELEISEKYDLCEKRSLTCDPVIRIRYGARLFLDKKTEIFSSKNREEIDVIPEELVSFLEPKGIFKETKINNGCSNILGSLRKAGVELLMLIPGKNEDCQIFLCNGKKDQIDFIKQYYYHSFMIPLTSKMGEFVGKQPLSLKSSRLAVISQNRSSKALAFTPSYLGFLSKKLNSI